MGDRNTRYCITCRTFCTPDRVGKSWALWVQRSQCRQYLRDYLLWNRRRNFCSSAFHKRFLSFCKATQASHILGCGLYKPQCPQKAPSAKQCQAASSPIAEPSCIDVSMQEHMCANLSKTSDSPQRITGTARHAYGTCCRPSSCNKGLLLAASCHSPD